MIQRKWVVAALAATVVSVVSVALLNSSMALMSRPGEPDVVPTEAPVAREYELPAAKTDQSRVPKDALVQKQRLDKEVRVPPPGGGGGDGKPNEAGVPRGGTPGEMAGVLGALNDDAGLDALLGDPVIVNGLIGSSSTQTGSGGLGARGGGFGGGGTAEGLGGLGTKGRGGAAGYGSGGSRGAVAETANAGRREEGRVGRKDAYFDRAAGDQYDAIVENTFQVVADAPLSTFSIDVDTASHANVRRYLEEGRLPPHDAVRVEELVNYFPYDYAPPTNGEAFTTHAEVTAAPWAEGHRLVRIGIKGREFADRATPPRNLVFLVDVSGSMNGADRLGLVQRGLAMLAEQLGPEDHVAMVVYAGAAGVVLEPTRGDRTHEILAAIDRLRAGGSTAGAAGIQQAYDLAREHFRKGSINRVILATDGDFNVGMSSEGELVRLIEEERKSGVFLTVLGVGRGNLQDAKMELLADKGNGNYAYIDSFAEMRKVLGDQVGGTLLTIAKDVKIQVEFNPAQVASYRLVGYENRVLAARDFDDDTKDAGEIGAGHTVTALYEVVPAAMGAKPAVGPLKYQGAREVTAAADTGELLTVKVRYKAPDGDTSKLLSFPVRDAGTAFAQASADTRWAAAVAGYGMLLRGSSHKGAIDWDWVRSTARDALGRDAEGYRADFLGLVEKARRIGGGRAG